MAKLFLSWLRRCACARACSEQANAKCASTDNSRRSSQLLGGGELVILRFLRRVIPRMRRFQFRQHAIDDTREPVRGTRCFRFFSVALASRLPVDFVHVWVEKIVFYRLPHLLKNGGVRRRGGGRRGRIITVRWHRRTACGCDSIGILRSTTTISGKISICERRPLQSVLRPTRAMVYAENTVAPTTTAREKFRRARSCRKI